MVELCIVDMVGGIEANGCTDKGPYSKGPGVQGSHTSPIVDALRQLLRGKGLQCIEDRHDRHEQHPPRQPTSWEERVHLVGCTGVCNLCLLRVTEVHLMTRATCSSLEPRKGSSKACVKREG